MYTFTFDYDGKEKYSRYFFSQKVSQNINLINVLIKPTIPIVFRVSLSLSRSTEIM